MKKYMIATSVAALLSTTSVQAADFVVMKPIELYVKQPLKPFDFSGYYAGTNLGLSRVNYTAKESEEDNKSPVVYNTLNEVIVTTFFGYNIMLKDNLLTGIDTDLSFAFTPKDGAEVKTEGGQTASNKFVNPTKISLEFDTAFRARAGYIIGNLMPFAAAGFAASYVKRDFSDDNKTAYDKDAGELFAFGYTVGAGLDYALHKSLFVRAEYRLAHVMKYVPVEADLNPSLVTATSLSHNFKVGLAYKF